MFIVGCAKNPEETPVGKDDPDSKPRLVGRIASIPADRNFVLIQSYGTWNVATGSILTTQGPEGRTANLLATGEKLGQYAAADIRTGTLEIGDGVYTIAKPPEQKETETEPAPELKSEPPAGKPADGGPNPSVSEPAAASAR
ncbi:MAG: hypothetical protein RLZZ505_387 [Verrucomicrobiota bacterium]